MQRQVTLTIEFDETKAGYLLTPNEKPPAPPTNQELASLFRFAELDLAHPYTIKKVKVS